MPFNPTAKNVMLDALDESNTQITHVGICTLSDPGLATNMNAVEATGGSPAYARQAVTWGAAAAAAKANTGALTFDVAAGTYGFFGLFNAATGNTNNYRGYIPFGGASVVRGFYSTDTTLTNDQLFSVAHGLADNDRVQLRPVYSEAIGTGLTAGSIYFVVNSATNTFKVSTTQGGAAVDITALGGGEGYFEKVVPEIFGAQGQITVAIGALSLDLLAF
jgi:hypothetical protein